MITITLKSGRSVPFSNRHPWLFSGAIANESGSAEAGAWVRVIDNAGTFIAYGLYNPFSQIRIRLYAFSELDNLTDEFWETKVKQANELREHILDFKTSPNKAYRIINSEGDGLSGLTVDRFGDYLSVQFTSLALYQHKEAIFKALIDITHCTGIMIRTESDMLAEENLELKDGLAYGKLPDEPVVIDENGVLFEINLATGQKTGFYLDQRANRVLLEDYVKNKSVLDLCTYSGGFALHALKAGASKVTAVDISNNALDLAKRNAELNNFDNIEFNKSDMFKYLDKCLESGIKFDTIILDPPKMTHSKGSVNNALSGYLKLNSLALRCLNPNGILFTCSCSGRVSREDFLNLIHRASIIAQRSLRILEIKGADIDHPVSTACPESEYLKCVVCYVQ